jgi:hypothetical protein
VIKMDWIEHLVADINNKYELGLTDAGFRELQRKIERTISRASRENTHTVQRMRMEKSSEKVA